MDNPMVSVIIAVRNGERFLRSAIESVLAQTYRPFEIAVIDGHSDDQTAAIAGSFPEARVVPQAGRGVADAYNLGIESAKTDFIAFLSYDDLWTPDKLSVQMSYLIAHPEIAYTIARIKFFLEDEKSIPAGFRPELLEGDHIGRIMETLVARKQVFDLVGKFDTSLSTAEDVDWYSRAADKGVPMAIMPYVLLHKRVHDANLSIQTLTNNQNLLKTLRRSIERKRSS
jgi:glycosyltransferase involved in cell wall biosynthesis